VKPQTTKANDDPISEKGQGPTLAGLKRTAHRELAAGVLKQATLDLRRFHTITKGAGRAVYCDACRWLTSNDASSPFAFLNVCHALGLTPEMVRAELISNLSVGTFQNRRRQLIWSFAL